MKAFLKKYHILMKLLALLIAVILWAVVLYNENPERSIDLVNVPVELLGQSELLQKGLVVSQMENETVTVKASSSFQRLKDISADDVTVRADVSGYTEPGTYNLSYDVSFLPNGITVEERTPERISIVVEEIVEKELEVRVEYEGTLPEGIYLNLDEASIEPGVVRVSGIASVMEQAAYAVIRLDAESLTEDYSGECEYIIVDAEGNQLESEFTKYLDRTVEVDIPVYMSKMVPVEVGVSASAGAPKTSVVVSYEPEKITIYGKASVVGSMKSIKLGDINVRDFVLTYDKEFPVTLPEGVSFYGDPVETVNVHVSLRDVDTVQLNATNISLENVPETAVIDLETTSLEITVRAQKDKLKDVDANNFKVSVDLADVKLQTGRQLVPATVKISMGGYDVCGTYHVMINVVETGER